MQGDMTGDKFAICVILVTKQCFA